MFLNSNYYRKKIKLKLKLPNSSSDEIHYSEIANLYTASVYLSM